MLLKRRPWWRAARGQWYYTMDDGKAVPLGVQDKSAELEAINKVLELVTKANRGPTLRAGTLSELVPQFLEHVAGKGMAGKTVRANQYELAWMVAVFPLTATVADITADRLLAETKRKSWSDSHTYNVLATVQRFTRWAGLADFRVALPRKESRGAESVISQETWELLQRETTGDFHQLLRMLWHTGARPSEIATLTVEGVKWSDRCAILKKHKTAKKGKQRVIRFGQQAMAILEAQRAKHKDGLLFRGTHGQAWTAHAMGVKLGRLCDRLGVKLTAYCFRHTFATRALSKGEPDTYVAALLGHANTRMIHQQYSHVAENHRLLASVADRVE